METRHIHNFFREGLLRCIFHVGRMAVIPLVEGRHSDHDPEFFPGETMQTKTNRIFLLASCCLLVFLAGCPESKYPLSDPTNDEVDQSLIGDWSPDPSGFIGKPKATITDTISREDGLPRGVLKWTTKMEKGETKSPFVEFGRQRHVPPPGQADDDGSVYTTVNYLVPTTVGDDHYFSVALFDSKWNPAKKGWNADWVVGYWIVKYKIKDGKLTQYTPGADAQNRLERAVKRGDLRGRFVEEAGLLGPNTKTIVTEPTDGLRKYVQDNDAWIFTEKHALVKK